MEKVTRDNYKEISKVKPIYLKGKFNWCVKRLKSKKQRTTHIFVR